MADNYHSLRKVLDMAFMQASSGKGYERHAKNEPFEKQIMMQITNSVGVGFPLGQAMKKIDESMRLERDAAVRELLGAIVYTAGGILYLLQGDNENIL